MQCNKSSVLIERAVHELCALRTYGVIVDSVSTYNMTTDAVDRHNTLLSAISLHWGIETKTETWENELECIRVSRPWSPQDHNTAH